VKVDDIAEQTGLAKGTIYLYFENKEQLFFSIIVDRTDRFYNQMETAVRCDQDFMTCFRQFILNYLQWFYEHKAFFKIIHSEESRLSRESHYQMHAWAMKAFQRFFNLLLEFVQEGQKQNIIRNLDPQCVAKALRGILNSFLFHRIFIQSETTIEQETDEIIDLMMNGLRII
jgi:AcrR family transcriptional regulator